MRLFSPTVTGQGEDSYRSSGAGAYHSPLNQIVPVVLSVWCCILSDRPGLSDQRVSSGMSEKPRTPLLEIEYGD